MLRLYVASGECLGQGKGIPRKLGIPCRGIYYWKTTKDF